MSLLICRKNPGETDLQVQTRLQTIIDDPFIAVLIVYGEGPDIDQAIQVCVARAALRIDLRRVVWVPDPDILSAEQKKQYFRKNKAAVMIGLDDKIAAQLTPDEASVILLVDSAFTDAGV